MIKFGRIIAFGSLLFAPPTSYAAHMAGYADLSGKVTGTVPGLLTAVYATQTDKHVTFVVFAIGGEYRVTNLIPGPYEISVRPAVGQVFGDGFAPVTKTATVGPDTDLQIDFALQSQAYGPDYVGGMWYTGGWADEIDGDPDQPASPDAVIEPYDKIFPPGRGRELMENICFGCHTPNQYAYNYNRRYASGRPIHDKDGWAITVDRMSKGVPFQNAAKASYFDDQLLAPEDYDVLIDYLDANFGVDAVPRAIELEREPELDEAALAKAQFVEYRFPNTEQMPKRATHTIGFNPDGNVVAMDRSGSIIVVDPRTGNSTDYPNIGRGESLIVDFDGTIWYGGVRHFDPTTKLLDQYVFDDGTKNGRPVPVSTQIFDSNGDLWLSLLSGGGIAKFDRKTNMIKWWDVPHLRARPYGISIDHNDKVWFAEYHSSGIGRFDPETEKFTYFRVTNEAPTNIRRLSADSANMIWTATWGSKAYQNGSLFRLNPQSGDVKSWRLDIPYTNPYDAAPDSQDNIWVATDNYLVMFNQEAEAFTRYPLPVRTDVPRLSITAQDTIWFAMRNAGHSSDYGGTAVALYPDKDKITTYAAAYSDKSVHGHLRRYKGPATPITGTVTFVSPMPQNPYEYARTLELPDDYPVNIAGGITMNSGASRE
ncbi:MAG: hypothetical protein KDE14_15745 [Rhodobacteraceae bacterium]|nr:hypothetical protein [Paracoccaceae bacterium]